MLESFKSEIVEAENDRNELLKWKVIIVAILMAAGFGVGELGLSNPETKPYILLILCIVPIVCVYTDLLCKHLQIRILVISKFFQDYQIQDSDNSIKDELEIFKSYEAFCQKKRSVFCFEDWAQTGSTYILCGLICIISIVALLIKYNLNLLFLIFFCVLGMIATACIERKYAKMTQKLNSIDD